MAGWLTCTAFADVSSVKYVHETIYNTKSISVPIETGVNQNNVNSAQYLMEQIDNANEILNGVRITNYANQSAFASENVIDVNKAHEYIQELIREFAAFTLYAEDIASFNFTISAPGEYYISWGDGVIDKIVKTNKTSTAYSHTYTEAGNYYINISGRATDYHATVAAISFNNTTNKLKIKRIYGSLSEIFPTLPNAGNPRFSNTFYGCRNLTGTLPPELFAGLTGEASSSMFSHTFYQCAALEGSIPSGFFGNLSGAPTENMFYNTFYGCAGLSGEIPAGLLGSFNGAPASNMFNSTFYNCSKLSGSIPAGLFGNIYGAPAAGMYGSTFYGCSGLSGTIPAGLFGTFVGDPAEDMFYRTFSGCSNLTAIANGIWDLSGVNDLTGVNLFYRTFQNCSKITSPTPTIAAGNSTKLWQHFTVYTAQRAFYGCSKMSDYATINSAWK